MSKIFEKFFCKHKWKTHFKREMVSETFLPNIVGDGYIPTGVTKSYINEVLICENCGKIKKLKY